MNELTWCSLDMVSLRQNAKSEPKPVTKKPSESCFFLVGEERERVSLSCCSERDSSPYGAQRSDNNNAVIITPTMHSAAGYASWRTPAVCCVGCTRVELRSDLLSYHKQTAAELVCKATFFLQSSHTSLAVFDSRARSPAALTPAQAIRASGV